MTDALAAEPLEVARGDDDDELAAPAECLKSSLQALKPDYRAVLQQVYLDEESMKDVAAGSNLTANNAAVRLHRARGALRVVMFQKCRACPLADCWGRQRFAEQVAA